MEQVSSEDFDCLFLRVQEELEYAAAAEDAEEQDLGMGFQIRIPGGFLPADEETAADIFWSDKRPPVILLAPDGSAGITFQLLAEDVPNLGDAEGQGISEHIEDSKNIGDGQGIAGCDESQNNSHNGDCGQVLGERRKEIKQILERIDDRTVFYRTGEAGQDGKVYWMEYKSFAADERIYNLLFLFQAGEETVMGTFFCIFEEYDKRRPIILDMFSTIVSNGSKEESFRGETKL